MKFDILKRPEFATYYETEFYLCSDVNKWLDQAYEILDKARAVYGDPEDDYCFASFPGSPGEQDTHKALLINVETIEKKECKHKFVKHSSNEETFMCLDCGKKLTPNWTVIDDKT